MKYPKINTLFNRDSKGVIILSQLSNTTFGNISRWYVTEKIDGQNIRILYTRGDTIQVPI